MTHICPLAFGDDEEGSLAPFLIKLVELLVASESSPLIQRWKGQETQMGCYSTCHTSEGRVKYGTLKVPSFFVKMPNESALAGIIV